MIKHIVMWKFKDETVEADKLEMKRQLEALKGVVPNLGDIEIGLNTAESPAAMDMVLSSEFQTMEDLKAYVVHPEHQKAVLMIRDPVAPSLFALVSL
jgi:hypothetical protein